VVFTVADIARHGRVGDRRASSPGTTAADAEVAFRRARGLLTADRMTTWLAEWAIDADDFVAWTHDVADGTATATRWCAWVCSGGFESTSSAVLAAAAAACELGRPPASADTFAPTGWVDRLAAATADGAAVQETITRHRLGWTRLRGVHAVAPSRGVAAELRQWVVHDGVDLDVAAAQAGCATTVLDAVLDAIEPATLRPSLAGARADDIMGPVQATNGWNLVAVRERHEPGHRDPVARARAAALLRDEAVARAVARHVGP
jgi:hypothetical protein